MTNGVRVRNSCYTNYFKYLCIYILIYTATTFRGLSAILDLQRRCNIISTAKTPSHTSIRRWINQVGYYNLTKPKEKSNDWIYFIDNSIRIENRKICLILGAKLSELTKGTYLTYSDLEIVGIWIFTKNKDIEQMIEDAITLTGTPGQICSDEGPDIMPSIRKILAKYPTIKHVPDIMHKTGNLLKKKFEEDARWKSFITHVTDSKRKLCQTTLSFICPPKLSGGYRFMNCKNVIEWAERALEALDKMTNTDSNWHEINEKLGWLRDCRQDLALFMELFQLAAIAKEGVRKQHIERNAWKVIEGLLNPSIQSTEGKVFANEVIDFIKIQSAKAEEKELLVESSEIIESAFSKLKLLDRECGNSGFTSSILGLAACFGATDYKSISKAFEQCDYKDVVAWGKKNVGETIQKKRRQFLKPKKRKNLASEITRFLEKEQKAA